MRDGDKVYAAYVARVSILRVYCIVLLVATCIEHKTFVSTLCTLCTNVIRKTVDVHVSMLLHQVSWYSAFSYTCNYKL